MKFPKSMHAEGWASHLEPTSPEHLPDALKPAGQTAKPAAVGAARFKPTGAGAKISATAPLHATAAEAPKRVDPLYVRPQPTTASAASAASIERDRQISWMIPAGAGVAIIAAVAIWTMNRPSEAPVTPPAIVVGSVEPQADIAAATPAPEASQVADSTPTTVAAAAPEPAPVEPARLGPPVTTTRPAVEQRPVVAQAPVPTARPDMVLRSAPNSPAATLTPPTTVAAAPTDSVPPGAAPIVMPPTSAGPIVTPPAAVPPIVAPTSPLASATPDANSASSVSPGAPPMAQAQPQPMPEDSGITVKVRMALAADATLSAVPIAVSTDHGVVKLEGQAPDSQTRERATVVASSALGVKAVDNRLTLPPPVVVSQAPVTQQ